MKNGRRRSRLAGTKLAIEKQKNFFDKRKDRLNLCGLVWR